MDIVVLFVLLNDHIRISIVEFTMELRILSHWLEFFDSVDLQGLLTRSGEKGFSLGLQLLNMDIKFFSFHFLLYLMLFKLFINNIFAKRYIKLRFLFYQKKRIHI